MAEFLFELVKHGDAARALRVIQDNYQQHPSQYEMDLGIGYLWFRDYRDAYKHFQHLNASGAGTSDIVYGMAGVAKWCLGDPDGAVDQWREGLDSDFADSAGLGLSMPLLLFIAAILKPALVDKTEIEEVLATRARDERIRNWPGPIVHFVLGRIDEVAVRARIVETNKVHAMAEHRLVDFYVAIMELAGGDDSRYHELVARAADTSGPEWQIADYFYDRAWTPEFFLARHVGCRHTHR